MYLVDIVRFKALRFAKADFISLDDMLNESQKIARAVEFAKNWKKTCIEELGIPHDIETTERSVAEMAYAGFLQNETTLEDWLSLYVILIPCYYVRTNLDQG